MVSFNVLVIAPVVKWISLLTSDQSLGVRVPPGAQGFEFIYQIRYTHFRSKF